jgi:hypothetical protein
MEEQLEDYDTIIQDYFDLEDHDEDSIIDHMMVDGQSFEIEDEE